MINIDFNWSERVSQATLSLLVLLLIAYFWFVFQKPRAARAPRFWVKFSLHILLWLSLLGFVLKPYWDKTTRSGTALIFGNEVPAGVSDQIRDSLKKAEILNVNKPDFSHIDTLVMIGDDFPSSFFERLMLSKNQPQHIQWISFNQAGHIKNLNWKGILRQREIQKVAGVVNENKDGLLKLKYGNTFIDSVLVRSGSQGFNFSFPAFSNGRTLMTLELNGRTTDTLRFYARKLEPLKIRFLLESPDFESRTLASWLGKNGHSVDYISTLSKDMVSEVKINSYGEPDILIVDPQNLGNGLSKKYLEKGKSILLINLENLSTDINLINKSFQTHFQVKADIKDSTKNASETTLPYHFVVNNSQIPLSKFPVIAEKKSGIIAVSLLNQTYPMILSGDSLTYGKIWSEIMAGLRPATKSNIDIQSPVYQYIDENVTLNNITPMPDFLKLDEDSIFLSPSAINLTTATATLSSGKSGWVSFADSLELYVGEKSEPRYKSVYLADFLRKYKVYQDKLQRLKTREKASVGASRSYIPEWLWFALILCILIGIWIEEKI